MSLGTDLSKEFHKLTKNVKFDEVCLFTKLQDAFINLKSNNPTYQYAIDIIHGKKSHVDFDFNCNWVSQFSYGQGVTRELADMMFVIYSHRQNQIRITYMQNKKGIYNNKFKADLCQLHLLSKREHITSSNLPNCLFGDPDILSRAILPSVGSYGVFYSYNRSIEMSYYPACHIQPSVLKGKSVVRTANYDSRKFGTIATAYGYAESQGTRQIRDFGDALANMQIGTPIHRRMMAHKGLIIFLANHIRGFMQGSWFEEYRDDVYDDDQNSWTPTVPVIYAINADIINRE